MLKKSIRFKDFNGEERTEDFYFHLSEASMMELSVTYKDGIEAHWQNMLQADDRAGMFSEFKRFIALSYGMKSPDGRRFIQSSEILDNFISTNAYSVLLMEICTDEQKAAEFFNGIMPAGLEADLEKIQAKLESRSVEEKPQQMAVQEEPPESEAPVDGEVVEARLLTREEITEMDLPELQAGLAEGRYKLQ